MMSSIGQYITCSSRVKRCLSSGGLPRLAGYSKSRSSPSNFLVLTKTIDDVTNSFRLAAVESMADIFSTPKFQPPTESRVFSAGLRSFNSLKRVYLHIEHYVPSDAIHTVRRRRGHRVNRLRISAFQLNMEG